MKKSLEEKIFKRFSSLFLNGKDIEPKTPHICLSLDVGNGWYRLIWEMCEKVEKELNREGNAKLKEKFFFSQIKEKFGALRSYFNCGNKIIFDITLEAEKNSSKICEYCGEKGTSQKIGGWIKTLCKNCRKEKEKKQERRLDEYVKEYKGKSRGVATESSEGNKDNSINKNM